MSKLSAAIVVFLAAALQPVIAQEFPSKRITMLVGYPPGGSTDIVARVIAEKIGARLNTTVVVENNPGASGMIAAQSVARAPLDGHTLLFAASNEVTILPALKRKMAYDTRTAFAPVALIGMVPLVLAVHPGMPVSKVSELVELSKKEPGRMSYASFGAGTSNQLAAELFKVVTGTNIVHVPYKGGAAAMPDLLSGRVEMCFHAVPVALPYIRAGTLRAIGYTGATRSPLMPDVPTMQEAGLPGFVVGSWVGLLAPAGTPTTVIDRLDRELRTVVGTSDVQEFMQSQGTLPAYKSPAEFAEFIDAEMKRWTELGAKADISVE
jgi:tripartite-type tricarboxylate transporter receptor subunit TctC